MKLAAVRNKPPKILAYPDERLKRVSAEVDFSKETKEELTEIVRQMGLALRSVGWGQRLGIAAPQIGINKRIMVVQGAVMINPTWTPSKAPGEDMIEGCYSVPGKLYRVPRAKYGWAKWRSIEGQEREFKLNGKDAIIFQHELDHLDGKCCPDVGTPYNEVKVETKKDPA